MKLRLLSGLALVPLLARSEVLPYISTSPQSATIAPGNNAVFSVSSTNAIAYQWRFNGTNIAWGTASSLVITNAQIGNTGYYVAIAKNGIGWTPSELAYLSVTSSNGILPFYNTNIPAAQAKHSYSPCPAEWDTPITNGTAQLVAGPALEELKPVGTSRPVKDGYFGLEFLTRLISTVAPGQTAYCRVDISFTPACGGTSYTQSSAVLPLQAGGSNYAVAIPTSLRFPNYIEWPDPPPGIYSPNQIGVIGETVVVRGFYYTFTGGTMPIQWRKDGQKFNGITDNTQPSGNPTLTLTNLTAEDAGVYDFVGIGAASISAKLYLRVQTTNGQGVFTSPRIVGNDFVCEFEGVPLRGYEIQTSTNLNSWTILKTTSGVYQDITLPGSNTNNSKFVRSRLLPVSPF